MDREIWIAEEATVSLQEVNTAGAAVGGYVEQFYVQDVSIAPRRLTTEFREPGVAFEQVKSQEIGFDIRIGRLFYRESLQLTGLKNRTKRWNIKVAHVNRRYSGTTPLENDTRTFTKATPTEGPDEDWKGGTDEMTSAVSLFAETEE